MLVLVLLGPVVDGVDCAVVGMGFFVGGRLWWWGITCSRQTDRDLFTGHHSR